MTEHEPLQREIPAYVASRLEGEALKRLEQHLSECRNCAAIVTTWKQLAPSFRGEMEELLRPHLAIDTLRDFALGRTADEDGAISGHLEVCASCSMDVAAWRAWQERRPVSAKRPAGVAPVRRLRLSHALLAAAVLVGVVLSVVLYFAVPTRGRPSPGPAWSGTAPLLVLHGTFRDGRDASEYSLLPGQPFLPIALQPLLPEYVESALRYRLDLLDESGRAVWSSELTAGRITAQLSASGVVTFLVPADSLEPGRYTLRAVPAERPHEPLLFEDRFRLIRP